MTEAAPIPEKIARAHELGYDATEFVGDKPGRTYPPHAHHETLLVTIAGYATLVTSDKSSVLAPGSEVVIREGEEHSAEVSSSGWYYMAAWRPQEAEAWKAAHPTSA